MTNHTIRNIDGPIPAANNSDNPNNDILDIYEDLLKTVWEKITPTLGSVTVATIMKRSIARTSQRHSVLKHLSVAESGFVFDNIRNASSDVGKEEVKEAFKVLVASLFDILAKLTGNILVHQLIKEVDGIEIPK